jgi:hypothetical protein
MHLDGSGMVQLTGTCGIITAVDRTVDAELPGLGVYPKVFR